MPTVDELTIEIRARLDKLDADLRGANLKMDAAAERMARAARKVDDAWSSAIPRLSGALAKLGVSLSVVGVAAFVKNAVDAGDAINDLSKRTGVAVETLSAFSYVAKLSGTDINGVANGLKFMGKNLSEAAGGSKTAAQSFQQLGLNFADLRKMSPEQQFIAIADKINNLGDAGDKNAASMAIFGKSGSELIPIFEGGKKSIEGMLQQANQLGLVFSKDEAEKMARFNDAWDSMNMKIQSLAQDGFLSLYDAVMKVKSVLSDVTGNMDGVAADRATSRIKEIEARIAETRSQYLRNEQALKQAQNAPVTSFDHGFIGNRQLKSVELLGEMRTLRHEADQYQKVLNKTAEATKSAENATSKATGALKKFSPEIENAARNQKELQQSIDDMLRSSQNDNVTQGMSELNKALFGVDQRVAELTRKYGKLNEAQMLQVGTTKDNVRAFYEHKEALERAEKASKALEERQKEMMKPFAHAFENIQDSLADMLVAGKFTFSSLADIGKRAAAEVASAWIIRPAMLSLIGGGASFAPGAAAAAGGGGGLGSMNFLSGGGSLISGLTNGLTTPFINTGGVVNIANALGFGGNTAATGQLLSMAGNFTPLSGIAGFGGGLAANLLFGGGTGSTVGSTLGGLVGTAFGGPLGALAGSFIGGGLGSLFGGKKPSNKLQYGTFDLATGSFTSRGGQTGKKFSQENYDQVTTLGNIAAQIAQMLGGITSTLTISAGDRSGLGFDFGVGQKNFGQDVGAFVKGLSEALAEKAPQIGDSFGVALSHIDFSKVTDNLQSVMDDLNFAAAFEKLGDIPEQVSDTARAFNALQEQIKTMKATTERLGLSMEKADAAADKLTAKFVGDFNKNIYDQILQLTDPNAYGLKQINETFDKIMKDAQLIGGDSAAVERLRSLNLEHQASQQVSEALQQAAENANRMAETFDSLTKTLSDTLNGLLLGTDSALSPEMKYALAKNKFNATSQLASIGNVDALGALGGDVSAFLAQSRNLFGSSAAYKADFASGQAALENAMGVAGNNAAAQRAAAARATGALSDTSGGNPYSGMSLDALVSVMSDMAAAQAKSNQLVQSLASDLTVGVRRTA